MKTITFLTLAVVIMACKPQYTEVQLPTPAAQVVKVVEVSPVETPITITASGKLESDENTTLSFKTGGIIAKVWVSEGASVRAGQKLAQLNLSEINAQVKQAQLQVDKLANDLAKFETLLKDSAITLQTVDDVRNALDIARSGLAIAQYNQKHSTIEAPFNGVVLQKIGQAGAVIAPGSPVLILGNSTSNRNMTLSVNLSDREVVQLQPGDPATILLDAYPGTKGMATVTEIAAQSHPRTGTFEVELQVENYPYPLKAGFFAKAQIFPSQTQSVIKLPMQALVEGDATSVTVYTAKDQVVERFTATPWTIANEYFTVKFDRDTTLYVIMEGAAYVQEGDTVQLLNTENETAITLH